MLTSRVSRRGLVTAPHHLAAQAGLAVLREGGNAIEAAVAAAATAAVVCPHRASLGGDGVWMIHEPGRPPVSIDAGGAAGAGVTAAALRARGLTRIPAQGPDAGCTVAGCLSGWQSALDLSSRWGGTLPLARLLAEAIDHAQGGVPVAPEQERCLRRMLGGLKDQPGFCPRFLDAEGRVPRAGSLVSQPALARTLESLAGEGLDGFYRGSLGQRVAADLRTCGALVGAGDLARHRPVRRRPLALALGIDGPVVWVPPPPTQGLATLILLGIFQRAQGRGPDDPAFVQSLSNAALIAARIRDTRLGDPRAMGVHASTYLSARILDDFALGLDPTSPGVLLTGEGEGTRGVLPEGEGFWIGAADREGRVVSYTQGLGRGFGSGLVLPETGLVWHGHGAAFTLGDEGPTALAPGRKPLHPLTPTLARLRDGRVLALGAMGGLAQPLILAGVFARAVLFGQDLQAAITAPRWRLDGPGPGRGVSLFGENRLSPAMVAGLRTMGYTVTLGDPFDEGVGQAGGLIAHPDGTLEGAMDPRGDGTVATW
ncbi:gamma-glutamyltransferase family protein [Pararhodospirillum photometricum]|uniref:Gamma-glutamyltransferase n=1 Tax=Pararhodospirillum photometricum DSM 122 TaxID=1150469 RepID=H6SNL4_PARPM|nr:gamma-glutamyltransferase [Pararhodospirillum photometricum]CCG09345.1 Gamma-glutamyltransferase [Pararhodospirillum photometricum DSM 122]